MFEVVTFCGFNVDLIKFNSIVKILTFLFEVGSSNPSHLLARDNVYLTYIIFGTGNLFSLCLTI